MSVAEAIKVREEADIHDAIAKRVASWWWGSGDDEIAGHLSAAKLIAHDPINEAIYLARVADDGSKFRPLKNWAYCAAAEFAGAKGSGQRKRSLVENYDPRWGRQAARDGMARALWPWLDHEMPGRNKRCQELGVGHQSYMRVRDEVQGRVLDGFIAYMFDLNCIVQGIWTRDMIHRWEAATGAKFDKALI